MSWGPETIRVKENTGGKVLKKTATDMVLGRTIVLPVTQAREAVGLRILPVGVVEETEKLRVIHDLTFRAGRLSGREGRRGSRK